MDNRRLVIALAVGLGLTLLWFQFLPWLDKKMGWEPPPQQQSITEGPTTSSSQPTSTAPTTQVAASPSPTSAPSMTQGPTPAHVAPDPQGTPEHARLGSAADHDPKYALQLNVRPLGAGIESVVLNQWKQAARRPDPYIFQQVYDPNRLDTQPFGTRGITLNGVPYDISSLTWNHVGGDETSAVYGAVLQDGNGQPALVLRKTFRIFPRSNENLGFEVQIDLSVENRTGAPATVKTVFNGPNMPPAETNQSPDRQVVSGYILEKARLQAEAKAIEEFSAEKENGQFDLTKDNKGRPSRWAGTASAFFGAVVLPEPLNRGQGEPDYIAKITAQGLNLDRALIDDHTAYTTFETGDIKVPAGATVTVPTTVYFGPKWRDVLDRPHYTAYPREYNLMLIIRGGLCGICTFGPLVTFIVWLLKILHVVVRDWGVAIIGLVAIVRILLHPITKRSQISMSRMSKLGPEMEKLKKKYADDKEALNRAMIEYHKEQGVGPYLGCLPMFLQTPIWIALYAVLQSTFELRHAPFLWNATWIHDLSQPDYIYKLQHPAMIPLLFTTFTFRGFNLLPVLLAAVMAIQQKFFMPKPATMDPQQEQMQKTMQWLSPIMFLFFFYNLPSGLNLYIFTSTAVGIIESKVVRDHIKAREEAEKAGKVFVETKPTRGSRRGKDNGPAEQPRRGIMGRLSAQWARLLEQAEQMRNDQDKRNGKKK
jgi:YidC/Oxa1 family membrane protein insertase